MLQSPDQINWSARMASWSYAYTKPTIAGQLKAQPDDFVVIEQLSFDPSGEGEHVCLLIRKCKQNTDQVAKQLARFCNVAYRDVGYSGMKDFFAITEQWFSVWLPKGDVPDWHGFTMSGVTILRTEKHSRKIKRGTHQANHFSITVRDLKWISDAQLDSQSDLLDYLKQRMTLIEQQGVPNYYGPQRFGRACNNMPQSQDMLSGQKTVNNRSLRSILLSSARSWLFNCILSSRIDDASWQRAQAGEPLNLDGSGSVFNSLGKEKKDSEDFNEQNSRLDELDIHPTAPLWGKFKAALVEPFQDLHDWEEKQVNNYQNIAQGLSLAGLSYQRRPLRIKVQDLSWQLTDNQLSLSFALQKGQFATSVLREIVCDIIQQKNDQSGDLG